MKKYIYLFDDYFLTNDKHNHIVSVRKWSEKNKKYKFKDMYYATSIRTLKILLLDLIGIYSLTNTISIENDEFKGVKEFLQILDDVSSIIDKLNGVN